MGVTEVATMDAELIEDSAKHILVVDDDTRIRDLLRRYLSTSGFRVTTASDAEQARGKLRGMDFDLLVVDIMMPGESGLSLTKSLNHIKDVPILMLTALSEVESRIEGLEAGADDYLGKPFDPKELVLRINSILKRQTSTNEPAIQQIMFGPYTFVIETRELKKEGDPIHLTDREKELMTIFSKKPGETVERTDLSGDGETIGDRTIDVQINRLRRRIETNPAEPVWLQTVRGVGYRLCVE
ncbi:response regulator [Lentilitoribacter sp. EG35]|jgi:two-component system phosphate regulon response regulator OmpR|uniref:response regulator n=2 Tax=unclassified Lentilitoribacter TaxID=2647570 RepID=UPI003B968310